MVGTVLHSAGEAVASLAVPAIRRPLVRFDRGGMDDISVDLEHFLRGGRNRAPLEFLDGVGAASALDIGASPIDTPVEGRDRKPRRFQPKGATPDPL